jgi:protein involved in polysaccharide export with SLBB domain
LLDEILESGLIISMRVKEAANTPTKRPISLAAVPRRLSSELLESVNANLLTLLCVVMMCGCASRPKFKKFPDSDLIAPGHCVILSFIDVNRHFPEARLTVDAAGNVLLPDDFGKVHVGGLTLEQAKLEIRKAFEPYTVRWRPTFHIDVSRCPQ